MGLQSIHNFLESLQTAPTKTEKRIQTAIPVRGYMISSLTYTNALGASNVINITLKEVLSSKRDKEIQEAYVFKNGNYKVSIIYGAKIILSSEKLYNHIILYIRHLCALLINEKHRLDRERYLFVASRADSTSSQAVQLKHTALSWSLTKTCKRAGIFKGQEELFKRMTC